MVIFSACGTRMACSGDSIGVESFEIPLNANTDAITPIAIAIPATIAIDEFLFIDNQPGWKQGKIECTTEACGCFRADLPSFP